MLLWLREPVMLSLFALQNQEKQNQFMKPCTSPFPLKTKTALLGSCVEFCLFGYDFCSHTTPLRNLRNHWPVDGGGAETESQISS